MEKAILTLLLLFFIVIYSFSSMGECVEVEKQQRVIGRYQQIPQRCKTAAECVTFCKSVGFKSCGCNNSQCCCIIPPPST